MRKPVLVFDGNCAFCRMWVDFWRDITEGRVEFQAAKARIDSVEFEGLRGAEAVSEMATYAPGYEWLQRIYRIPPLGWIAELLYAFIARHRNAGFRITRALWGERIARPVYHRAAERFSRALGFLYLIAFASFGMQVRGLIGSQGLMPVPGGTWWPHSDFALLFIAWGGVSLSAVGILAKPHSKWQRLVFAVLFLYYLLLVHSGLTFMSFQWDLLLLETGFLAIFLRPALPRVWLFHWLLFRLIFESGAVKLLSGDPTWRHLDALSAHYFTQPLPTAIAWYVWQLPLWFHRGTTLLVLLVECVLPFLIFGPRRMKRIAAWGLGTLQVLILLTGNYTFFNLLTLALCLLLFDDKPTAKPAAPAGSNRWLSAALFLFVMTVSATELGSMFGGAPRELQRIVAAQANYGLVNPYGLFATMTTSRPEIEVQASMDGEHWQPYVFRYKPGPLNRAPRWVAPFQPRLDWQMWFAALGTYRENPWFVSLLLRLLQGSKPVLALLEREPFPGQTPQHIRAMIYDYRFTTIDEKRQTGNWWKRELKGTYFPPVSLRGTK